MPWMYKLFLTLFMVVSVNSAAAVEPIEFPHFRHVDKLQAKPELLPPLTISLLADEDFAPFSFKAIDGKPAGISLQLALAACTQLRLNCAVKFMPFASLLTALRQKQGDVVVGGPKAEGQGAQGLASTRPYYLSFSRFFGRIGVNLQSVDAKALAGRRIGVVKNSAQEQFLKKNFGRAALVPFDTTTSLFEALRTGTIELAFADTVVAGFWLKGDNARGCCTSYGGAFTDRATITRNLTMLMRPEDKILQQAFDNALDQLQENGTTSKVLEVYLPSSPF